MSLITVSILLPLLISLVLAGASVMLVNNWTGRLASNYVQNLSTEIADRIDTPEHEAEFFKNGYEEISQMKRKASLSTKELPINFTNIPSVFAVLDADQRLLFCSEGEAFAKTLVRITDLPLNETAQRFFASGLSYTFFVRPARDGQRLVFVAIKKESLFGNSSLILYSWPFVMAILAILGLFFIVFLWNKVIGPLEELEKEASNLKLGDTLHGTLKKNIAPEISSLRNALTMFAGSASEYIQLEKNYINDILKAQEEERADLAREIHDGPLQDVTALIQRIRMIYYAQTPEELGLFAREAEGISMDTVREMREFCNTLTPPWLELGLRQSLVELADRRGRMYSMKMHTSGLNEVELDEDQILCYFRIAQQAIVNAATHGDAQNVTMRLNEEDGVVRMEIEDDGSGFVVPKDFREVRVAGHRGLSNMRERMQLLGGTCEIISQPNHGTTVICELDKKTL